MQMPLLVIVQGGLVCPNTKKDEGMSAASLFNFSAHSAVIDIQAAGESIIETIRSQRTAWTAAQLSELLGMSQKHVLKMAKEQRMPSYRIGGSVRFDPGAVATWLEERHVG